MERIAELETELMPKMNLNSRLKNRERREATVAEQEKEILGKSSI